MPRNLEWVILIRCEHHGCFRCESFREPDFLRTVDGYREAARQQFLTNGWQVASGKKPNLCPVHNPSNAREGEVPR